MDESEEDIDVAGLMGFSSFGGQPSKRRKYNSNSDAVIDVSSTKGDQRVTKGSGSNKIPLGKARPSNDTPQGDKVANIAREESAFQTVGGAGDVVDNQGYVDDTPPDSPFPVQQNILMQQSSQTQALEDTKARSYNGTPNSVQHLLVRNKKTPPLQQEASTSVPSNHSLPPKPPVPSLSSSSHRSGRNTFPTGGDEYWRLRKGLKNENGDTAYFDPSFVEDPWEELRAKELGMGKG
ncbi:hypothetical protein MMC16_003428 [Acarospora aff. strigata]|nr:hypothetical protein [Acarospora aff. strigata]